MDAGLLTVPKAGVLKETGEPKHQQSTDPEGSQQLEAETLPPAALHIPETQAASVLQNMQVIILKQAFLSFSIFILWISDPSHGSDVTQKSTLWRNKGDDATIDCEHTKDASFLQMYWYRQLPGETMELIVFTSTARKDHDFGEFSRDKFSATKTEAQSGTFTVKQLQPEDGGLYFCAVSEAAEAYFGGGTKLTVLEDGLDITPPRVKILRPSKAEDTKTKREKKKTTLVCVASDFYPDHVSVSWKCSAGKCDKAATDSAAKRVKEKYYRITSRLKVLTEIWEKPENTFTCSVTFYNGTKDIVFEHTIKGIQGNSTGNTRENYLRITQKAKLSYCVFIVKSCTYGAFVGFVMWKLQGSKRKR
ncbi:M1-specific T cell receptor beta chain-like [Salarias fasciatus]|uniref:M1-specific T cell receptor beta chain-like n=1 Tax=Salarias fasciatus TaxID=181472 RepID=UPI001176BBD9|nr:M1-specific T cell receptor beta chain-like [Salarias fasciatus]